MSKIRAIKNISFLWVGSLTGAGCAFLTQLVLARALGPKDFGVFASVLSLMGLLVPLVGFGVAQYWLKEFGKEGWLAMRLIKPSLMFIFINMVLVMAFVAMWAVWGPHGEAMRVILIIMSIFVLGQVSIELISGRLQLEERYGWLAVWQLLPNLARLLLVLISSKFFGSQFDVESAAYLFALVSLLVIATSLKPLISMAKGRLSLRGHGLRKIQGKHVRQSAIKDILKTSLPFGLAAIFQLIYFQSSIVLVKYIAGDEAAGHYNVAFTVMVAVLLFPSILYQKFLLPKIHRWANYDRDLFYKVYRQGNIVMLLLGGGAMFLVWLLSPIAIPLLFGDEYKEAVALLMILAFSAPIMFVANSIGATLVTQENMWIKVKLMGSVAIVNVVLNFMVIPFYGALGAAVTTVISNLVLLVFYYVGARIYVFGGLQASLKKGA